MASAILSCLALFAVGALFSIFSARGPLLSGLRMLAIGLWLRRSPTAWVGFWVSRSPVSERFCRFSCFLPSIRAFNFLPKSVLS